MEKKYGKQLENIFDDEKKQDFFDEIQMSEFHNFELQALADKIKSQALYRPKPKMLYY